MNDPTLDALLAAYAGPDWYDGQRTAIADRLEELGDERAEVVRTMRIHGIGNLSTREELSWYVLPLINPFKRTFFNTKRKAEAEIRRRVLALFPELAPTYGPSPLKDIWPVWNALQQVLYGGAEVEIPCTVTHFDEAVFQQMIADNSQ